jgi:Holliday junction DNA helicase RuvA
MIGKLKGILDTIESDYVILDVGGVGYIIHASAKTIAQLPSLNQAASFLINMQVKEDDISLYGFISKIEQEWFDNLIMVQGIGPRLALTILSSLEPNSLIAAILERNKEAFKHISGVGPKLAERIFTELTKKANQYSHLTVAAPISQENNSNINDALVALINLGYNRAQSYSVCKKIYQDNAEISINELIKLALKELSSS